MDKTQLDRFHRRVDDAARHACSALLALDEFRTSDDPVQRATYQDVHDLIADLSSLIIELDRLPLETAGA